jgi:hypothetical protein
MPQGASERKLAKSLKPNQKGARKNLGERARHLATQVATLLIQKGLAILILRWEDKQAGAGERRLSRWSPDLQNSNVPF